MAFAEKRGKTWRARYLRPDGTYGSEPGFPLKTAALRFGEEQEAAIRNKTWIDPHDGELSLDAYWDEWLPAQAMADSTRDRYTGYYRNHLSTRWGSKPIREITGLQVDAHKRHLRETTHLSVATISAVIGLLRRMMDDAAFDRRILTSPVRPTSRRGEKEPDEGRKGMAVELEAVLAICERLPRPEALLAITTAFTGLRWGEAAGMRRSYLFLSPDDPASGWYEVDKKLGALKERHGNLSFGPPKDREARTIQLPGFLVPLLLAHLETLPAKQQLLFPCGSGEGYRRGNFGRLLWRPACDGWPARPTSKGHAALAAAHPIAPGFRFHDLRHSHETWMTEDHIPKIARDERLGHVTPGMEGTYNHTTPAMRKEILEVLSARWERCKTPIWS